MKAMASAAEAGAKATAAAAETAVKAAAYTRPPP